MEHFDAVVIGGGHNGLVAACYLARAGQSVLVLERLSRPGGAAVSTAAFAGVDAHLSRYSYLVSLLPDRVVTDLDLDVRTRSRPVASYTPVGADAGLLVEREPGPATEESFRALTGSSGEYAAWQGFAAELDALAQAIAPGLLEPLASAEQHRARLGDRAWERFVTTPIGHAIEDTFADDTVRGVVLTDALIGTFSHAHDPSLRQNRCFLYHVIGNGTGEWKVPVGGMGAVTAALEATARKLGVDIRCDAEVRSVEADGLTAQVRYNDRTVSAAYVLAGVAPATLERLRGRPPTVPGPEGAQVKVNLVLTHLPRLRSGIDPRTAFAGTLHVDETYGQLQSAYDQAAAGQLPDPAPAELYCHTLTDPSILGAELSERGWHTLTLFGLHTPARLFADDNDGVRAEAVRRYLRALNAYLAEPIEDCLATDADGRPCLEATSPYDIEAAVGMPGGHIFHGDLAWPWAQTPDELGTWGVETDVANLVVCGSGARRGGGVSGIGGHNAAHAILERLAQRRG